MTFEAWFLTIDEDEDYSLHDIVWEDGPISHGMLLGGWRLLMRLVIRLAKENTNDK